MNNTFSLLSKSIVHHIQNLGIISPSQIQELAIPCILRGSNSLLIAPTGMGKTLSAILPVFDGFLRLRTNKEIQGISILYITPLRALNRDIYRRVVEIGDALNIRVEIRHGDTPTHIRSLQAKFPPDMLITTPETLQAVLPGKRMKEHLRSVRWVIVDEIHELAIDKRGSQLAIALERLCNLTKSEIQRIGLSATVGEPEKVANFLAGVNREIEVVKSPDLKRYDVTIEYVSPKQGDFQDSKYFSIPANYISRIRRIIELIREHKSTLIFTNTREHAEALGSLIRVLDRNLPVKVHHGSLSKEIREEVEKKFQEGETKAIICTSSLELGIDIGSVDLVIQYLSPRQAVKLVQRVGRSGHSISREPKGKIITGGADDILESIALLKRAKCEDFELLTIHQKPYDVLAHQTIGLLLDEKKIEIDKAFHIVSRAYPFKDLTKEEFMNVLRELDRLNLIIVNDDIIRIKTTRTFRYYYENISMIPDIKQYSVFDFILRKKIGTLDQEFVAKHCTPKTEFIMHGQAWKVINRDDERLKVDVEPIEPSLEAIPSWEGEIIPVEYKTALDVGKMRGLIAQDPIDPVPIKNILFGIDILEECIEVLKKTGQKQIEKNVMPTDRKIVIETFENIIIIHACFGNLINETLGLLLTTLLSSRYGLHFRYQIDPYRLAIACPYRIDPIIIKKYLLEADYDNLYKTIEDSLQESDMFTWRHWHVARRFGVIERKADYNAFKAKRLVNIFRNSIINEEAKKEIIVEKLDVENTSKILQDIQNRNIEIEIIESKDYEFSPLATPILDKIVPHSLLRPLTKPLSKIVEERLLSQNVKLVCMYKGDWEGIRNIRQLPEKISCQKCGSTLLAVTYPNDNNLIKIAYKKKNNEKLKPEEVKTWTRAWRAASLLQIYGKKAVIAMAGRGVGPNTAIRILKKPQHKDEDLFIEILKAERNYARTRMFWD